jgi:hypothetical protein
MVGGVIGHRWPVIGADAFNPSGIEVFHKGLVGRHHGISNIGYHPKSESRNGRCADIVAAADRAQRFLVNIAPLDRFALLVRRELRLAAKFDALGFRVGAPARRALLDAAAFQLRRDAKHGEHCGVARQTIDGRDNHHVAGADGRHEFLELRPVGRRAADLLPVHALASGRLELGELAGEVLGVGRDAGIAENRAPLCNRLMKQESAIGSAG